MLGLNTPFDAELPAAVEDIPWSNSKTCLFTLNRVPTEDMQDAIDGPVDSRVTSSTLASMLNPQDEPGPSTPSLWSSSSLLPGSATQIMGRPSVSSTHDRLRVARARRSPMPPGEHDGDGIQTSQSSPMTFGKFTVDLSRVSTKAPDLPRTSNATNGSPVRTPIPSLEWKEKPVDPKGGSALEKMSEAIRVRELHHWCATVAVLLLLHLVSDCVSHRFQYLPPASEWCVLLLYALGCSAGMLCAPRMRPYAGYLLAFGSLLMTCQLTWHWHSHVAQIKDSTRLSPPAYFETNPLNGTAAAHASSGASPPYSWLYRFAFGSSGVDVLDAATAFVVLFQNCVQASFLCRLGVRMAATVSMLQWIMYACWPFIAVDPQSTWACRMVAAGIWTAHLIRSSYVLESDLHQQSQCIDDLREEVAESRRNLKNGQDADSVLNHILKNTMADASGCIDLSCQTNTPDDYLSKASDILFRGMWWCKLREAILKMVAGCYETVKEMVDVQEFAKDFVRGRKVTLECPPRTLKLDPMVCNVVLDNAATNAIRHGCPDDPRVKLSVEIAEKGSRATSNETQGAVPTHDMTDASGECTTPVEVRFVLRNRANPSRPLKAPWSSQQPSKPLPGDRSRPTLSDGLGLQHISMAANASGMCAQLWQQDAEVFFELSFDTTATQERVLEPLHEPRLFPPGLHILILDDSDIARTNLHARLVKDIPTATVTTYGKDLLEVKEFRREALERGNVLIMDENVHVPGESIQGSDVLMELRAAGYDGFACIRSGSSTAADKARSLRSGAQWHVGKEVWLSDLIRQLRAEYHKFRGKGKSRDKESDMPLHNNSFASCED